MTSDFIWDYGTPYERVAMVEEFDKICKEWRKNSVFEQDKMSRPIFTPRGPVHVGLVVDKVSQEHIS
jgi:hypothetical protein